MKNDMTPQDIALIRAQFALTRGVEAEFAAAFYARLFQIAPQVRAMFPQDMAGQGGKLMAVLGFAVGALDRAEVLAPAVQVVGAVTGAALNAMFLNYYREIARIRFRLMRLSEVHGPEAVLAGFAAAQAKPALTLS